MHHNRLTLFAVKASLLVVLAHILFVFYHSSTVFAVLMAILAVAVIAASWQNALLLTLSLSSVVLIPEAAIRLFAHDLLYYREHERFQNAALERYRPDLNETVNGRYGDLVAMAPALNGRIGEQRLLRFRSDPVGYRNDRPLSAEHRLILVGDSFIAGNSTSQEDMVASHLANTWGIGAYNIGYPGNPGHYFRRLRDYPAPLADRCVLAFLFEGNDFLESGDTATLPDKTTKAALTGYVDRVRFSFEFGRVFYGFLSRATAGTVAADSVAVSRVGPQEIGFLKDYVARTERTAYQPDDGARGAFDALFSKVDALVFIPEKYRVYHDLLEPKPGTVLPDANRTWLLAAAAKAGKPVIDLTEPFLAEARRLAPSGQYVFWRDDTHWNGTGQAIAAQAIAERYRQGGLPCAKR